jgi:SAM-dependent methyltransferase
MRKNSLRLYKDLAWTWPIISPPEDYVEEAEQFRSAIHAHSKISVKTLLDLGCGGGHNDFHLKQHFEVTGVDISEEMLGNARRLNPEVKYLSGDMRTLRLGETFDSVIAADSILYMLNEKELESAFRTAFEHLKTGGVFCTYVEEWPKRFVQNGIRVSVRQKGDVNVVFVEVNYDPDIADTTFDTYFIYVINEMGNLRVEEDYHVCGIFPLSTWKRLLASTGFEVCRTEFGDSDKYPFFACVKPA